MNVGQSVYYSPWFNASDYGREWPGSSYTLFTQGDAYYMTGMCWYQNYGTFNAEYSNGWTPGSSMGPAWGKEMGSKVYGCKRAPVGECYKSIYFSFATIGVTEPTDCCGWQTYAYGAVEYVKMYTTSGQLRGTSFSGYTPSWDEWAIAESDTDCIVAIEVTGGSHRGWNQVKQIRIKFARDMVTFAPTAAPTADTQPPSSAPTLPTSDPTATPSVSPTATTDVPSSMPTTTPSTTPTRNPSVTPTAVPTGSPTTEPTAMPTVSPTATTDVPSTTPTNTPSTEPTYNPSMSPTEMPTGGPTTEPTQTPSGGPTIEPTETPTDAPSMEPTEQPTVEPTTQTPAPTQQPTAPTLVTDASTTDDADDTDVITTTRAPVSFATCVAFWLCYVIVVVHVLC